MDPARLDAKLLYRRLDSLFADVDGHPRQRAMESFLEDVFRALRDDLRLQAGLLYAPRRDDLELIGSAGDLRGLAPPETIDPALVPLQLVFRHGVYIFAEPGHDDAPSRFGLPPASSQAWQVPRVGWPANGSSVAVVKMRTW